MRHLLIFLFIGTLLLSCEERNHVSQSNALLRKSDSQILRKDYHQLSDIQKKKHLDSIYKKIQLAEADSIKIKFLFDIAAEYYYLEENRLSFQVSNEIYEFSKKDQDLFNVGKALYYMGDCYEESQKDSAYYYYKESEKIYRSINNKEKLAHVLYNKAAILFTEGNYVESEVELIKTLKELEGTQDYEFITRCYFLQASIHIELDELDKAIQYLDLTKESILKLKQFNKNLDVFLLYDALAASSLGNVYDKKGQYDKSIKELEKRLTPQLKEKYPIYYCGIVGNFGYSNMKKGNFSVAKKYIEESIRLTKQNKDIEGYLAKIINYGEYYLLTKDTVNANRLFKEALPLTKTQKKGALLLKTLDFLSVSDPSKANFYKDEYVKVSDSLVKQQRISREKFARIEYETSKVEDANKVLNNRNLILIIGITIAIIIFLIIIIVRHKIAQKREAILLAQKEDADEELFNLISDFQIQLAETKEKEQNRISKELHDGIMNQIYGVRLNLGFLNGFDDSDSKEKRLFYIAELQKIEREVRELSHGLNHETKFKQSDFTFLLNALVASNDDLSSTNFTIDILDEIDFSSLSSVIKVNVYRMLQEMFLNVNKYAKASQCSLKIHKEDDLVLFEVTDNGVGFNVSDAANGIGIKNIKDRSKLINAQLDIQSDPGQGTKIIIRIKKQDL
ncbi:ATP-binding protein [Flavobacterium enshiense]|uniref:tetratricopeptide repeat-containing sensor histidine kinase n=1 Tax=Flavobacterium enshiense TaxID=1341165 RepID=UPI00345CBECA